MVLGLQYRLQQQVTKAFHCVIDGCPVPIPLLTPQLDSCHTLGYSCPNIILPGGQWLNSWEASRYAGPRYYAQPPRGLDPRGPTLLPRLSFFPTGPVISPTAHQQAAQNYIYYPQVQQIVQCGYKVVTGVQRELVSRRCSNCGTTQTPSWRRCKIDGTTLCNACGLYSIEHKVRRPFDTKARRITKPIERAAEKGQSYKKRQRSCTRKAGNDRCNDWRGQRMGQERQ